MKHLILLVLALTLVGCGTTPTGGVGQPVPTVAEDLSRLEVTDTLRLACAPFGFTDPEILAAITLTEQGRLDGGIKTEALDMIVTSCSGGANDLACMTCLIAVVDQVFGE